MALHKVSIFFISMNLHRLSSASERLTRKIIIFVDSLSLRYWCGFMTNAMEQYEKVASLRLTKVQYNTTYFE